MATIHSRVKFVILAEVAVIAAAIAVIVILVYRAMFVVRIPKASDVPRIPDETSLMEKQIFPPGDPWNTDISNEPIDVNSDTLIASIGAQIALHPDIGTIYHGVPMGIPFVIVSGDQPKVPVTFQDSTESDPGPYPIPPDAPIEGGLDADGDRHVIILDKTTWLLYELYSAFPDNGGRSWRAVSGAIFDLNKNSVQRPIGWTSADAAGLPIFPGLVRYGEVQQGRISHALRFTVTQSRHAFVFPATHFASKNTDSSLPPMGMRVRLKHDFDITAFPASAQVILQALKTYGMILADNGGNWYLSGAPDPRWNDEQLSSLKKVIGVDFEVVRMGQITTALDKTQ